MRTRQHNRATAISRRELMLVTHTSAQQHGRIVDGDGSHAYPAGALRTLGNSSEAAIPRWLYREADMGG